MLTACGPSVTKVGVHPDSTEFRKRFVEAAQERGRDITLEDVPEVQLGEISATGTVGLCTWDLQVFLEPQFATVPTDILEPLVFHEFGHCVLGKGHSGKGVMATNSIGAAGYQMERDKYLDELFK